MSGSMSSGGDGPCEESWGWSLSSQPTDSITFLRRDTHWQTDRQFDTSSWTENNRPVWVESFSPLPASSADQPMTGGRPRPTARTAYEKPPNVCQVPPLHNRNWQTDRQVSRRSLHIQNTFLWKRVNSIRRPVACVYCKQTVLLELWHIFFI